MNISINTIILSTKTIIVTYKKSILHTPCRITVLDYNKDYNPNIVISSTTVKSSPASTTLQQQHCLNQTDFYINIVPTPVLFQHQSAVTTAPTYHQHGFNNNMFQHQHCININIVLPVTMFQTYYRTNVDKESTSLLFAYVQCSHVNVPEVEPESSLHLPGREHPYIEHNVINLGLGLLI